MVNSGSLDYWRNYFRAASSDIFDIIDHAIMVAASDCPKEFKLKRDGIAERLFSCKLAHCLGCDKVELVVSVDNENGEKGGGGGGGGGGHGVDHGEMNMNHHVSNYSYREAEALNDEIEEESQCVKEVLRIKEILLNRKEESDSVLFESLRRLQLMELTLHILQATMIGKAVERLRKHRSKDICELAKALIKDWIEVVDKWHEATEPIAENTPDSVNPSVVDDEEGLPLPPMDEGALFVTQTGSMELSRFFDCMDDDGNPHQSEEFIKNREDGRTARPNSQNIAKRKSQASNEANIVANDSKNQQEKKIEAAVRLNKPVTAGSCPGRSPKSTALNKGNIEPKMQQNILKGAIPKRPQVGQLDKFKCSDDDVAVQLKLEATKRKLQAQYQQVENAKRQRKVQVVELHDLPKQGVGRRNPHVKPGNQKRQWTHGRR